MYTDLKVKEELERCVATACIVAGLDTRKFPAKFMGKKKRENNLSLKYAYYAILQNFNSLSLAKKSKTDVYFRYIFRTILFRERTKLLYEISKWEPSMGSVENEKLYFAVINQISTQVNSLIT